MRSLTEIFINTVKEIEDVSAVGYRSHNLKSRLQKKYPQLKFVKPNRRNQSELVLCDNEYHHLKNLIPDDSDTDTSMSDSKETQFHTIDDENIRHMYHAAQILKDSILNSKFSNSWPPTAYELNHENAKSLVPVSLYNFIAWMTGLSDEITDDRINLSPDHERKVLSISQDMIYLSNYGKQQTPKHWALGMTIRHLTNSSKLIGLLNRLGHCVFHSSVLEHDTALATLQLNTENITPPGISKETFSTIVWDNNDFGEETSSGSGKTPVTNGIVIQWQPSDDTQHVESTKLPKSKSRTLSPPETSIPKYVLQKKTCPLQTNDDQEMNEFSIFFKQPRHTAVAFCLSKLPDITQANLPGWTGFNVLLSKNDVHQVQTDSTKIGYLPVIDVPPTQMNTVYFILKRSLEIANELNIYKIVIVMDQAIHSKAQQIRWQNSEFQRKIVVRLGDFHTTMAFLGAIYKRYQDSGFEDIIIESGLVASGSLNGVMNGHQYNRSMRTHSIMYESLQRLRWQSYLDTLQEDKKTTLLDFCFKLHTSFPTSEFFELVNSSQFEEINTNYQQYILDTSKRHPTFAFWSSYIDIVGTLLLFLRATREGNWNLHLGSVRSILPWMFAYDRVNYSRHLTTYWFEMKQLKEQSEEIHEHFMNGKFVVQRQNDGSFSRTACDQIIEQTINRDSKTKGGLTGITLNKGAVHRWILSFPERANISHQCEEMAGKTDEVRSKKDLDKSRTVKDEKQVQDVCSTIQSMYNPFNADDSDDCLFNISSGSVVPQDVCSDINEAFQTGERAFLQFVRERLHMNSSKNIFDPIKFQKLKTFSSIGKTHMTKVKNEIVTLRGNRNLLMRLLMIANVRNVDVQDLLTYNLCTVPQSLAKYDGTLCKTNKAALLHHLELKSQTVTQGSRENDSTATRITIVDGMAMLQQTKNVPSTFGELAMDLLKRVVSCCCQDGSNRVDFVTDNYPPLSIKGLERRKRSLKGVQIVKITGPDQKTTKQFSKFLSAGQNKESLVTFLFSQWSQAYPEILQNKIVVIAHGVHCHLFMNVNDVMTVQAIRQLECDHEEADTRMLLHAFHASNTCGKVIIHSPDTDVLLLSLCHHQYISATMFVNPGKRCISISAIAQQMDETTCKAFIGFHVFTGCDSISAFRNKGKIKGASLIDSYKDAFQNLGAHWDCEEANVKMLEKFVCELYGQKLCDSVDQARFNWFRLGCKSNVSLPPNRDSLLLHIQRANYQTCIFRKSLQQVINAPSPTEHGWSVEKDELIINWMTLPPAPENVLHFAHCRCAKNAYVTKKVLMQKCWRLLH